MNTEQQAVIDRWIAFDPGIRCVVYTGLGKWWPAEETHDGPQPLVWGGKPNYGPAEFTIAELVAWCEGRL